jgi:hypothetical protein
MIMESRIDRAAPHAIDAPIVVARLRAFLLGLAAFICAGTPLELWLGKHYQSLPQLIPFVLCGLGLIAALAALLRPGRATLLGLRGVMALLGLGSLLGVYEHIEHNLEFALEIRPGATFADVWLQSLRGSSPLLAPGILALAAAIAIAATYAHPALAARRR